MPKNGSRRLAQLGERAEQRLRFGDFREFRCWHKTVKGGPENRVRISRPAAGLISFAKGSVAGETGEHWTDGFLHRIRGESGFPC